MRDRIQAEIDRIEREENVRVIYACESGSRAWGFPSRDSDYDVRMVYVSRRLLRNDRFCAILRLRAASVAFNTSRRGAKLLHRR